jgi:hypothetical protein
LLLPSAEAYDVAVKGPLKSDTDERILTFEFAEFLAVGARFLGLSKTPMEFAYLYHHGFSFSTVPARD